MCKLLEEGAKVAGQGGCPTKRGERFISHNPTQAIEIQFRPSSKSFRYEGQA